MLYAGPIAAVLLTHEALPHAFHPACCCWCAVESHARCCCFAARPPLHTPPKGMEASSPLPPLLLMLLRHRCLHCRLRFAPACAAAARQHCVDCCCLPWGFDCRYLAWLGACPAGRLPSRGLPAFAQALFKVVCKLAGLCFAPAVHADDNLSGSAWMYLQFMQHSRRQRSSILCDVHKLVVPAMEAFVSVLGCTCSTCSTKTDMNILLSTIHGAPHTAHMALLLQHHCPCPRHSNYHCPLSTCPPCPSSPVQTHLWAPLPLAGGLRA